MEQNAKIPRLRGLDGIRGIAIILVILNHVGPNFLIAAMPEILRPTFGLLFSSGVTGVSLLFILSGFFMAYIYPNPKNAINFLQKRYTRIFPLFLTMCIAMLILHNFPTLPWFTQIAIILGLALVVHVIWVYGIKRLHSQIFSRVLFLSFIGLQVLVGLFYAFYIMRHPAIYLNQQLPPVVRETIIGLVNATLTLPFGDYVPMLDGVYWSLGSEVLFYILYPILVVPMIVLVIGRKRWVKIAYVAASMPMFAGLYVLSFNVAVLSMFQFQLFFYFVTGMILAYLLRSRPKFLEKLSKPFIALSSASIVIFFLLIFFKQFTTGLVNADMLPWVHILWAFPLTYLIMLSLHPSSYVARFLSAKPMVFLGTISYSMYLSHTAVVHFVEKSFVATNLVSNIVQLGLTFFATITLSYVLYQLLEKPYFMKAEKKSQNTVEHNQLPRVSKKSAITIFVCIIVFVLAIFSAFQSEFNFFSKEQINTERIFVEPKVEDSTEFINMRVSPKVYFSLQAKENNLGIVIAKLSWTKEASSSGQQVVFKIKEKGAEDWYATSAYDILMNRNNGDHIFGFPTINDSKGKWYDVELSLLKPNSTEEVIVDAHQNTIKSVYLLDKNEILKNPAELFSLIRQRMENAITNPLAQKIMLLVLPFMAFSLYLVIHKRRP